MYFKDIIGQGEIKRQLIKSAQTNIVPHAQLFTEQGGAGAFPLALAYARYLNCTNRTENDACGKCPSCLKYNELAHPDLHFVFPIVSKKEKKKEICDDYLTEWRSFLKEYTYFNLDNWLEYIEAGNSQALIYSKESDEIIHKLNLKIYEATYRILLVWLPEKLHPTCANKLLKIIEEPPANTVILMVSETPDQVLGTILSRAQRINVRAIQTEAITQAMISQFGLSPDDAKHVGHLSRGSFLKAVEAISLGEENKFFLEQFKGMMRNSWARNVKGMKTMADTIAGIGRERQKNFLAYCQHLIRENFMYRFQSPDLNYMNLDEASFAIKFAPFVNERNVIDIMDELAKAEKDIAQNVNAKMVFFDLSLRLTVLIKRIC
ncbi:ATP-binding protein [Parabacteroides bouchesdurhonensis]|uniref:DNA polymerase III subunit n=1 Tax=Parabacteroides bouchesdurhonensis TaxID=1936995 RepID=UPI000C8278E4|nr:DNA polymerase III subunit delta [Parabacteroides bouchesdurhonensis]